MTTKARRLEVIEHILRHIRRSNGIASWHELTDLCGVDVCKSIESTTKEEWDKQTEYFHAIDYCVKYGWLNRHLTNMISTRGKLTKKRVYSGLMELTPEGLKYSMKLSREHKRN